MQNKISPASVYNSPATVIKASHIIIIIILYSA